MKNNSVQYGQGMTTKQYVFVIAVFTAFAAICVVANSMAQTTVTWWF